MVGGHLAAVVLPHLRPNRSDVGVEVRACRLAMLGCHLFCGHDIGR